MVHTWEVGHLTDAGTSLPHTADPQAVGSLCLYANIASGRTEPEQGPTLPCCMELGGMG